MLKFKQNLNKTNCYSNCCGRLYSVPSSNIYIIFFNTNQWQAEQLQSFGFVEFLLSFEIKGDRVTKIPSF